MHSRSGKVTTGDLLGMYLVKDPLEGRSMDRNVTGIASVDGGPTGKRAGTTGNDVGAALRNAFQATVEEDVPQELLDLLRRLD